MPKFQADMMDPYVEGQSKLPGVLPDSSPEMPPEAIPGVSDPNKLPAKWRT